MPAQTRLKPSYKLEMKHCQSAPGSQLAEPALFKVFPAGRGNLPNKSYFGKTGSKISHILCNIDCNRAEGLGCHEGLRETKG